MRACGKIDTPISAEKKRRHRQTARARQRGILRAAKFPSPKKPPLWLSPFIPRAAKSLKTRKIPFSQKGRKHTSRNLPAPSKKPMPSSRRQARQTQKRGRLMSGDPCGGPLFQQTLKAFAAGNFSLRKVAKRGHYGKLHIELFKHSANPNGLQTRANSSV